MKKAILNDEKMYVRIDILCTESFKKEYFANIKESNKSVHIRELMEKDNDTLSKSK